MLNVAGDEFSHKPTTFVRIATKYQVQKLYFFFFLSILNTGKKMIYCVR